MEFINKIEDYRNYRQNVREKIDYCRKRISEIDKEQTKFNITTKQKTKLD